MIRARQWPGASALALALFAQSAGAQTVEVNPLPETLVPDGKRVTREAFTARPGDLLFSGKILRTEAAVVEGSAQVQVDRFSDTISPGDELTSVMVSPSIAAQIGASRFYCGRDQRSRSQFMALMIGEWFSKFKPVVRFCFIDSDRDMKFDKFLLAGAKDKTQQAPRPIEPLPYRLDMMRQMNAEDEVRVRYRKHVPTSNKVELEVEVLRAGKKEYFDYILWSGPRALGIQQLRGRMMTNPKKIPYPSTFYGLLGASLRLNQVSPTGEANFVLDRELDPLLFRPVTIQVTYIYIYY